MRCASFSLHCHLVNSFHSTWISMGIFVHRASVVYFDGSGTIIPVLFHICSALWAVASGSVGRWCHILMFLRHKPVEFGGREPSRPPFNYAQCIVVMPCFMCVEVAMWCRAKMWKWGGTETIGLSRGDVRQVTSRASCWANDWCETNSLQKRLRRRRNDLCMHRLLDKSTSFSFSSGYQILILWPYQPYRVLLDHSDSLMSEVILLLSSGRVVSVIPIG